MKNKKAIFILLMMTLTFSACGKKEAPVESTLVQTENPQESESVEYYDDTLDLFETVEPEDPEEEKEEESVEITVEDKISKLYEVTERYLINEDCIFKLIKNDSSQKVFYVKNNNQDLMYIWGEPYYHIYIGAELTKQSYDISSDIENIKLYLLSNDKKELENFYKKNADFANYTTDDYVKAVEKYTSSMKVSEEKEKELTELFEDIENNYYDISNVQYFAYDGSPIDKEIVTYAGEYNTAKFEEYKNLFINSNRLDGEVLLNNHKLNKWYNTLSPDSNIINNTDKNVLLKVMFIDDKSGNTISLYNLYTAKVLTNTLTSPYSTHKYCENELYSSNQAIFSPIEITLNDAFNYIKNEQFIKTSMLNSNEEIDATQYKYIYNNREYEVTVNITDGEPLILVPGEIAEIFAAPESKIWMN